MSGEEPQGAEPHITPPAATLRSRAWVALVVLIVYSFLSYLYVEFRRSTIIDSVSLMNRLHGREEALTRAALSVSNAMFALNRSRSEPGVFADVLNADLESAAALAQSALEPVAHELPELRVRMHAVQAKLDAFRTTRTLAALYDVRSALGLLGQDVGREAQQARERRRSLNEEIRREYEAVATVGLLLGFAGLGVFGIASHVFFTGIAGAIRRLRQRAGEIVSGRRGPPLPVTRRDELGELTEAVNQLAVDLEQRETQLARAARLQAHRERMASVGALAASMAHEINNPLATISVLTEDMRSRGASEAGLEMLQKETARIAGMTRHLAAVAAPRATAPELSDLNVLVEAACDLLRFDARLGRRAVEFVPDRRVPPVNVVPDAVTQVVIDLVIALAEPRLGTLGEGAVGVRTGYASGMPFVRISLPGDGVPARTPERSGPAAKDAGTGVLPESRLAVVRALAADMQAQLDLVEAPTVRATLWLPVQSGMLDT